MGIKVNKGRREPISDSPEQGVFNFSKMLEHILEYIMQNKITVLLVLIVIVGIVTGGVVYLQNQKANREEATKIYDTFYLQSFPNLFFRKSGCCSMA